MKKGKSSLRTAEVLRFLEISKTIPDVRQDKIEAVRKQIASGTYIVSAASVASSMVDLCLDLSRDSCHRSRQECDEDGMED